MSVRAKKSKGIAFLDCQIKVLENRPAICFAAEVDDVEFFPFLPP